MMYGVLTLGSAGVISPYVQPNPAASPVYSSFGAVEIVGHMVNPTPTPPIAQAVVQEVVTSGVVEEVLSTPNGAGEVVEHPAVDNIASAAVADAEATISETVS